MPQILVQHRKELLKNSTNAAGFCGTLKKKIRKRAAKILSVPERTLSEGDFSFMFLEAGPYDDLFHDIQVIVFAHADEYRVERSDRLAEYINAAVLEALIDSTWKKTGEVSFSVSLILSELGYHAAHRFRLGEHD